MVGGAGPQTPKEFMVGHASPETPREALYPRLVGCPASLSLLPQMYPVSGPHGISSHQSSPVMPCPPDLVTPGVRNPDPNVPAAFSLLTGQDQARPRLRAMRTSGYATEDPSMSIEYRVSGVGAEIFHMVQLQSLLLIYNSLQFPQKQNKPDNSTQQRSLLRTPYKHQAPAGFVVKNLPGIQETWVQSLGWEDPLEKEMVTHSRIPAWRISWTEEPGGLQSIVLQRVERD